MKLFFWQLNDEEKLSRTLWSGLAALTFLYIVLIFKEYVLSTKIIIALISTSVYLIGLYVQYKKLKK
ncbi:hypothetical protein [Solibacillus sp. CAU 1738]|uniref:hypothetical protein n=1 Tax=Solibacillus sp. CAU 1738 TaxID=3140363 RepID=UPI0032606306